MPKLNQIIAIEKGVKNKTTQTLTSLHRESNQTDRFDGHSRTYQPLDDEGEKFPDDDKKVQLVASKQLEEFATHMAELFNITGTKDVGNTLAVSDVVVDEETVLAGVPATFLLFLEKQLLDLRCFVEGLPVLNPAFNWSKDQSSELHRTEPSMTSKTKKIQKPIVLYPATERHPAQTQLVSEDQVVGNWSTTKFSGAMAETEKKAFLKQLDKLQKAVKFARENANSVAVDKCKFGDKIFDWLMPA